MEKSFLYSFFWVARKLFMLKKNYPNQQTQKGWETLMGLDVWNLVALTVVVVVVAMVTNLLKQMGCDRRHCGMCGTL